MSLKVINKINSISKVNAISDVGINRVVGHNQYFSVSGASASLLVSRLLEYKIRLAGSLSIKCSLIQSLSIKSCATIWLSVMFLAAGCTPSPPDARDPVTAPIYSLGDSAKGAHLFEEHCAQCHRLKLGSNHKGPQLIGVYDAPAAQLTDYKYSTAMTQSNWVWDSETLDKYIKDPLAVMPDTRMQADPITDENDRQDIIAYLSTLGRADLERTEEEHAEEEHIESSEDENTDGMPKEAVK